MSWEGREHGGGIKPEDQGPRDRMWSKAFAAGMAEGIKDGYENGLQTGILRGRRSAATPYLRSMEEELLIAMLRGINHVPDTSGARLRVLGAISMAADLRKRMEGEG